MHTSEYSVEHLLSLDAGELATLLSSYIGSYRPVWGRDTPDLEGLAKTLRQAVKVDAVSFAQRLRGLASTDVVFVYEIVEGYSELWREKARLPWGSIWGELLWFIDSVLRREAFFQPVAERGLGFVATSTWVISSVGRLLEAGCRSDEFAIDPAYHDTVSEILQFILLRQAGEQFKGGGDAVNIAINSPRGQAIEALINLALRSCRLCGADEACRKMAWEKFEGVFDAELSLDEAYEFPTLVARYLPNFVYMSASWVESRFDSIFSGQNHQRWLCAMEGYASVTVVYREIYVRLRDGGHIARALDADGLEERAVEKYIQNIAVAYFNGFEELNAGGMALLFERNKPTEIRHLAWFVWTLRSTTDEGLRSRVLDLWKELNGLLDLTTEHGKRTASVMSGWIEFIDRIDATTKPLIMLVAPYCEVGHNGYSLLEGIARIAKSQPLEAAEIWQHVLPVSRPSYPTEALTDALESLVLAGGTAARRAQEIASTYAVYGDDAPAQFLLRRG